MEVWQVLTRNKKRQSEKSLWLTGRPCFISFLEKAALANYHIAVAFDSDKTVGYNLLNYINICIYSYIFIEERTCVI